MAKEKEEVKGLIAIAKKMAEFREGTTRPSGKKDDVAENQVTEMDMIAGICSAALFGSANRNSKNYTSILNNPDQYAYLGRIWKLFGKIVSGTSSSQLSKVSLSVKIVNLKDISKLFNQSEGGSISGGSININIAGITNIDELNKVLTDLAEKTNNEGLLDGLTGLFTVISKINELTSVDTSTVITNIENINELATKLDQINEIKLVDTDKLNQIVVTIDDINKIISSVNNLPKDIIESNIFKQDDKLQNALEGISKTIEIINNKINIPRNFESKTEQLNKLLTTGKLVDNLHIFLKNVEKIVNGIGEDPDPINLQGQIQGLGELIQGIISIANFNGKIDTKAIKELTKLVAKNGSIATIIQNINNLGLKAIDKSSIEALEHIKNYFDIVSELSLLDKLRIMMNIEFFKYYVNNSLPNLIVDVDKNFKGINLENKDSTLNNLSKYFYALKNIASLSFKDQVSLYTSINVLRGLIIEDLGKLIKDINTKFKDIKINENITQVFDLFDQIKDLTINSTFDEQRKSLYGIHKFLFGSSAVGGKVGGKIGRGLDFIKEQSSVLSIINRKKKKKENFASIKTPLDNLKNVFDSFNEVLTNFKIDNKDVKEIQISLDIFNNGVLGNLIKIGETNEDEEYLNGLIVINDFITEINKTFDNIKLDEIIQKILISQDTYKQFQETIKLFKDLKKLIEVIEAASKVPLSNVVYDTIGEMADKLAVVVNKFADIDPAKVNAAIKIMNEITKFILINAGVLFIGTLVMSQFSFGDMFTFIVGITTMVVLFCRVFEILSKFDPKDVENKIKLMHNISLLMVTLGATVTICTLMMRDIDLPQLGIFLAGIGALLTASVVIIWILTKIKGDIKESLPIAKDLSLLIIACGLSIGLASFIGQNTSPGNILVFGVSIAGLIISILVPIKFYDSVKSIMFDGVADLGKLVLYCGFTLALAGLVTEYLDMGSLFKFTLMLGLLVSGIMLAVGAFGKKEIQGAKDLGTMVLYCSAALLFGGMLFTLWPELKNGVKEFAITLVLFTGAILLVAGLAALMGREALKYIINLNKIILWASSALLIGGLLFMLGGLPFKEAVKDFALTLFLFILGVSLSVALVGLVVNKENMAKMWMLALLVSISALAITLGPILLQEYGVLYNDVWQFLGISLLFVGGMALIVWGLSNIDKMDLIKGILATAAIEALIYGLGLCIGKLCETIKIMNTINNLWDQIGNIGLIFGAVGLVVAGLGLLVTGPQALLFAAGAASLATLEGIIWRMSKCILGVVKAVKALNEIKNVDVSEAMKPFVDYILSTQKIITIFDWGEIAKIAAVTKALSGMGNMIANIAEGVKSYAELKVPIAWDPKTGKPIGFRQLTNTDFTNAATNISTIISTVGGAILAIYDGKIFNPVNGQYENSSLSTEDAHEMFSSSWLSTSKFTKVVKSVSKMGSMISSIAHGIQDYANLKIPTKWNADGKPIDFKKLTDQEFKKSSESIAKVITTLGMAIVAVYNGQQWDPTTRKLVSIPGFTKEMAREMFSSNWLSKSPFKRVIDSTSKLGNVISSLAKGIQNYANLTIPTKWNKDGKPIEFTRMGDTEFTKAGENIGKVIISLGQAIMTVANSQKFSEVYEPNRLKNIIDSIGKVSNFIGPLSNVIVKYATGKFYRLEYKDGKLNTMQGPEGLFSVEDFGGWEKIKESLDKSISNVLLGLGMAIYSAMNPTDQNEKNAIKLLTDDNKKVTNFLGNIKKLSDSLKPIFENIQKIMELNIQSSDIMNKIDFPFDQFCKILSDINDKNTIKYWLMNNPKDTAKFINGINSFSDSLLTVFNNIKKVLELSVTSENIIKNIDYPFDQFCKILLGIDTENDIKYWILKNPNDTARFTKNISEFAKSIGNIFEIINTVQKYNVTGEIVSKNVQEPFFQFYRLLDGFAKGDKDQLKKSIIDNGENINKYIEIISSFATSLSPIFSTLNQIQKYNLTSSIVEQIKNSFGKYLEIANLLTKDFSFDNTKFNEFMDLNSSVSAWINVINLVDLENTGNKTNVLANSITTLFNTIANLQQNSGFADHVDTVKRYVEAINDVDIDKIESMTNLAFAVTNLGDKIGNIDKFTDTLAKKIALTLNELSKQIKDASVIIKNADTLHKKRETSIKNSIGKITDLMDKHMVVEIKNEQPTTTLTGGTGGSIEGGGGTDTNTTPGGASDTTLVQTPPSSNSSSSERSGGSTVEIDYDKLAKAIARAFKQM